MLTYEEALARILQETPSPEPALVPLEDALGLVLARPIRARGDLPSFDNSAVDGYALRSSADAPPNSHAVTLRLIGESRAGAPFCGGIHPGEAVRIFTGAVVPRGTEGIVMQEQVERRDRHLLVPRWPSPGQHVRRRGEDIRKGTQAFEPGTRLGPAQIGLLAALGMARVPVYPRPRVAIVVTGDELVSPGDPLARGEIYESNGALLGAMVQQTGARVVRLGVARDALRWLVGKIYEALSSDVVLIAGGVSVGERDLVREALAACRVKPLFWRINIKPGMPFFFGKRGKTLVFGLPGNPVSVYVTFEELVTPALYRLMGRRWQDGYTQEAVLGADLQVSASRRTHFIRVACSSDNGRLLVQPVDGQGSHQLRSLAEADGWIRMTTDEGPWAAGQTVAVKRAA